MKIVNLTPHALNLMTDNGNITIPASGTVARATTDRVHVRDINVDGVSVSVNRTKFGEVTGLPDPAPDTVFVVSAIVANAVPDRDDVFIVDDAVRDSDGRIIGARALAHV